MDIYQHDEPSVFRFVLRGELGDESVQELRDAWAAARSALKQKRLIVDVSALTHADSAGLTLLSEMRASGADLTASAPLESSSIMQLLGIEAGRQHERTNSRFRLFKFLHSVRRLTTRRGEGLSSTA